MKKASTLSEALEGMAVALGELAKEAGEDIANSYQAVLTQDTGWSIQSRISDLTQDRAQEISHQMIDTHNSPTVESEREM